MKSSSLRKNIPAYIYTRTPYMKGAWGPALGSQRRFPGDRVLQKAGLQMKKKAVLQARTTVPAKWGAARQAAIPRNCSSPGSSWYTQSQAVLDCQAGFTGERTELKLLS